jgi:glycosyltransferase involved in cell wall biosynthesis
MLKENIEFNKLSIIIPSLNQGNYLEKNLNSILNQGYPNLEIIIVDGGSTDNTLKVIEKFKDKIDKFIFKKDRNQANAINIGIQESSGDWLSWQNSDDMYINNCFQFINNIINTNNVDVISGDIYLIDDKDKLIREIIYCQPTYKSLLAEGMVISNQSTFWKKSLHSKIGYIDENYNYSFDYDFFIRLLKNSKNIHFKKYFGALRIHNLTKSYNNSEDFNVENKIILKKYPNYKLFKYFYMLKRLLYYLSKFELNYIYRGFKKRF